MKTSKPKAQPVEPEAPAPRPPLSVSSRLRASAVAIQAIQALNQIVGEIAMISEKGLPADPKQAAPEVTPEEFRQAFGEDNLARVAAAHAALFKP